MGMHSKHMHTRHMLAAAVLAAFAFGAPPALAGGLDAWPNPSGDVTRFRFRLEAPGEASLSVHDALGRHVRTVAGGVLAAGTHEVAWDGRTDAGAPVAAGVYVARLLAAGRTVTRTFARIR